MSGTLDIPRIPAREKSKTKYDGAEPSGYPPGDPKNPFSISRARAELAAANARDRAAAAEAAKEAAAPPAPGTAAWYRMNQQAIEGWGAAYSSALDEYSRGELGAHWRREITASEASVVPQVGEQVRKISETPRARTAAAQIADARVPQGSLLRKQDGSFFPDVETPSPAGLMDAFLASTSAAKTEESIWGKTPTYSSSPRTSHEKETKEPELNLRKAQYEAR